MEATRIIAVRHGETSWNVDARIQGQKDIELNDTGRWQASRVGAALKGEKISAVYSSDLGRAHQTAQPIWMFVDLCRPSRRCRSLSQRRALVFRLLVSPAV